MRKIKLLNLSTRHFSVGMKEHSLRRCHLEGPLQALILNELIERKLWADNNVMDGVTSIRSPSRIVNAF